MDAKRVCLRLLGISSSYEEGVKSERVLNATGLRPNKITQQIIEVVKREWWPLTFVVYRAEPEQEEDARSEKSGITASEKSTAASSTEPASVYAPEAVTPEVAADKTAAHAAVAADAAAYVSGAAATFGCARAAANDERGCPSDYPFAAVQHYRALSDHPINGSDVVVAGSVTVAAGAALAVGELERRVGGKFDRGADVRERMSTVVHDLHSFARERCRARFDHERVREPIGLGRKGPEPLERRRREVLKLLREIAVALRDAGDDASCAELLEVSYAPLWGGHRLLLLGWTPQLLGATARHQPNRANVRPRSRPAGCGCAGLCSALSSWLRWSLTADDESLTR